jgi:hypothetical protein
MTSYDAVLKRIGSEIDRLPACGKAALFLACAISLRREYEDWVNHRGAGRIDLFERATAAVREYVTAATPIAGGATLLSSLEEEVPPGDTPDEFSSTNAQDCWICLDAAVRVIFDTNFEAGPCIEYALEPQSQAVSEHLFGVSQVGSGPEEDAAMETLLGTADFRAALNFVEWAVVFLAEVDALSNDDFDNLINRAMVLQPAIR